MVRPGGIGDPDGLGEIVAYHELGGDAQGTGTARRLRRLGAAAGHQGGITAEQQLLHDAAVFDIAFDTEVVLGLLVGQELLLGLLDAVKDRSGTGLILVDTDPQIDLVAASVGTEGFGQAQDRIRWGGNNLFKHGIPCSPLSSLAGKVGWQTKAPVQGALRQLFIPLPSIGENRFLGAASTNPVPIRCQGTHLDRQTPIRLHQIIALCQQRTGIRLGSQGRPSPGEPRRPP